MTVAAKASVEEYNGNGITLHFAARFRYLDPTHLEVKLIAADGTVTTLAYGVDYAATSGPTNDGGTVTMTVAPAAGERLRIKRVTPRAQSTDYTTGDSFPAESHEAGLDRAMLVDQEQDDKIADTALRALLVPDGETAPELAPAAERIGGGLILAPNAATGDIEVQAIDTAYQGPAGPADNTYSSRAALALSDPARAKAGLVAAAALDAGELFWNAAVPAVDHQARGRRARFVPPNIAIAGAWIKGDGVLRSRDIQLSPYNSGADNLSAWNVWRDEMQTLQDRQEGRPLVLTMDEDAFAFAGANYLELRQSHLRLDGRGAKLSGIGLLLTNAASVNHQQHCRVRDLVIAGAPQDGLQCVDSYYLMVDDVTVDVAARYGFSYNGGNNAQFARITGLDCAHYGFLAQRSVNPRPGATTAEVAVISLDLVGFDFRRKDASPAGTAGGGIALYECESVRIRGNGAGTIQLMTGGIYDRAISIERGRDVTVDGVHFEGNATDIYAQPVARVAAAWTNDMIRLVGNDCTAANSIIVADGATAISNLILQANRCAGAVSQVNAASTGIVHADNEFLGAVGFGAGLVDLRGLFDSAGLKLPAGDAVHVGATKVLGAQGAAVADPAAMTYAAPVGGATVDANARASLAQLAADVTAIRTQQLAELARLRAHGIIAP